jgi:uncharacterized protein YjcR
MAIDWSAVRRDYEAGHLSLRAIGEKHGCAHSTIANYASRNSWTRSAALVIPGQNSPPDTVSPGVRAI